MKVKKFGFIKKIIIFIVFIIIGILLYSSYLTFKCPLLFIDDIKEYSFSYDVSPYLIAAVINTESDFNPKAKSPKGAIGLMQIMPSTGEWIAEKLELENYEESHLYDPNINIKFGTWYLSFLKKEFNNDEKLVLAAYNAGGGRVKQWLTNNEYSDDGKVLNKIPFEETENYVKRVEDKKKMYKKIYTKEFSKKHSIKDSKIISILNSLKLNIKSKF